MNAERDNLIQLISTKIGDCGIADEQAELAKKYLLIIEDQEKKDQKNKRTYEIKAHKQAYEIIKENCLRHAGIPFDYIIDNNIIDDVIREY